MTQTGERSVSIGGNATNSVFTTGERIASRATLPDAASVDIGVTMAELRAALAKIGASMPGRSRVRSTMPMKRWQRPRRTRPRSPAA